MPTSNDQSEVLRLCASCWGGDHTRVDTTITSGERASIGKSSPDLENSCAYNSNGDDKNAKIKN